MGLVRVDECSSYNEYRLKRGNLSHVNYFVKQVAIIIIIMIIIIVIIIIFIITIIVSFLGTQMRWLRSPALLGCQ